MNAPPARSARFTLCDVTTDAHRAVEAAFRRRDLRQIEHDRTFPSGLAAIFRSLKRAWPQRLRRDLLTQGRADIEATVVPVVILSLPNNRPALIGTANVLEGSRSGGRSIRFGLEPQTDPHASAAVAANLALACFGRAQQVTASSTAVSAHA